MDIIRLWQLENLSPTCALPCIARDLIFLTVGVPKESTEAIDFWEKQGFAISGKEMEWNGFDVVIMERTI